MRLSRFIGTILVFIIVFSLTDLFYAHAATKEELKNQWREVQDYPITRDSEEWDSFGLLDMIDILNPPEDVIRQMSTEQLSDLLLKYPYLELLNFYPSEGDGKNYVLFFAFMESNCDIYWELLKREDGYIYILQKYRDNPFDVKRNNEEPYFILTNDPVENAEIFGCQFVRYYHQHFSQMEYELAKEIITEKMQLYSNLTADEPKYRLNFLSEIEPPTEIVQSDGIRARAYYEKSDEKRIEEREAFRKSAEELDAQWDAQENAVKQETDAHDSTDSIINPDAEKTEAETKPETETKTEAEAKTETKPEVETKTEAETEAETKPETESKTKTETGTETKSETEIKDNTSTDEDTRESTFFPGVIFGIAGSLVLLVGSFLVVKKVKKRR